MAQKEDDEVQFLFARPARRRNHRQDVPGTSPETAKSHQAATATAPNSEAVLRFDVSQGAPDTFDGAARQLRASTADINCSPSVVVTVKRSTSVPPLFRYKSGPALPAKEAASTQPPTQTVEPEHLAGAPEPVEIRPSEPTAPPAPQQNPDTPVAVTQPKADVFDWRQLPYAPPELLAEIARAEQAAARTSLLEDEPITEDAIQPQPTDTHSLAAPLDPLVQPPPSTIARPVPSNRRHQPAHTRQPATSNSTPTIIDLTLDTSPIDSQARKGTKRPPPTAVTQPLQPLPQSSPSFVTPTSTTKQAPPAPPALPRPWTSSLYHSLVLEMQSHFPFSAFARRHARRRSEVFEAFSQIVVVPVLERSSKGLEVVRREEVGEKGKRKRGYGVEKGGKKRRKGEDSEIVGREGLKGREKEAGKGKGVGGARKGVLACAVEPSGGAR